MAHCLCKYTSIHMPCYLTWLVHPQSTAVNDKYSFARAKDWEKELRTLTTLPVIYIVGWNSPLSRKLIRNNRLIQYRRKQVRSSL